MDEMQPNGVTSWTALLNRINEDPKVSQVMSAMGRYLSTHPLLALAALTSSSIAALPVGIFLTFALVTSVMSAVGFLFFEGLLLFAGGLVLLSVLFVIGVFSLVVSLVVRVLYMVISKILNKRHLTKGTDNATSKLKETQ